MPFPLPFIFVQSSNTKYLQYNKSNRKNPFKIFSDIDKAFVSFLKLENKNNCFVKVLSIKKIKEYKG
jgi:hypothetical protein